MVEDGRHMESHWRAPSLPPLPTLDHREQLKHLNSSSLDSSEGRDCQSNSETSIDLDQSVYASEIAALMSVQDSDSQHGSGLLTEIGSALGSSEQLSDIEYIDELSRSEPILHGAISTSSTFLIPPLPYELETSNQDSQDYSSGQYLLVPEADTGADSDCEISTQTVIHAPGHLEGRPSRDDTDSGSDESDLEHDTSASRQLIRKSRSKEASTLVKLKESEANKLQATTSNIESVVLDMTAESKSANLFPSLVPLEQAYDVTNKLCNLSSSRSFTSFTSSSLEPPPEFRDTNTNILASQSIFNFVRSDNSLMCKRQLPELPAERMHPLYHHHPHHRNHHQHQCPSASHFHPYESQTHKSPGPSNAMKTSTVPVQSDQDSSQAQSNKTISGTTTLHQPTTSSS